MKFFILAVFGAALVEVGCIFLLVKAWPDASWGYRSLGRLLLLGGLVVAIPLWLIVLYRLTIRKPH